ncbi:tyrosine--tRNA ligase [Patescibacteria group bacterium]|nr:MAG: tyrosine--tRNA ligase [Patescibacteria group bacterium]
MSDLRMRGFYSIRARAIAGKKKCGRLRTMKESARQALDDLLTRGVGELIDPDGAFRRKLEEKPREIVIKLGADPSCPDIHLGHAVILRKLRKFQDLGCKVVFLIGDFTAQIGDPSGKSKVRPQLSQGEIEANMKTYLDQVGKILSTEPEVFSWIRNSDWFLNITDLFVGTPVIYTDNATKASVIFPVNSFFAKTAVYDSSRMQKTHLKLSEIHNVSLRTFLTTLQRVTHARLIERDMFQERIKKGEELYMHEMLYPVLQGIDSSVLARIYGSCDLEMGGTDQIFNMLMGRDIMKANDQEPQAVLACELLEGLDGKEKMSKSLNNYVGIADVPSEMFGKIMSLPDTLLIRYFSLCTYTPLDDIEKIAGDLEGGRLHPRDAKSRLAREVVEMYHGKEAGRLAQEHFEKTFRDHEIPTDILELSLEPGTSLAEALLRHKLVASNSEFRRLLAGGALEALEKKLTITSPDFVVSEPMTIRIGKKRFVKLIPK